MGDCGCSDLYYCPTSQDVECPRHSGFDTCCGDVEAHQPLPDGLRDREPRPLISAADLEDGPFDGDFRLPWRQRWSRLRLPRASRSDSAVVGRGINLSGEELLE